MRILAAGTFDPSFARNRRLLALLERRGHEVTTCQIDVWGDDRYEIPNRRKVMTFARAAAAYPRLIWRFFLAPRADVVLVLYPGWFDMLVVGVLARARGIPVLFDPFISIYDTVVTDRRLASKRSIIGRATKLVDKLSLRFADRVLADTPAHADYYADLAGIPRDDIGVVWLGAQDDVFHPLPNAQPVPNRVLFHGTFIALQGIPTILEAAKLLEPRGIVVRIVGGGQEQANVDALIEKLQPTNIEMVGRLPLAQIPLEIASATLCLGVFGTTDKARRVVPNKVFECVAVGRPVVTGDTPAIRSAFSDTEIGLAAPGDAEALAGEIARLLDDDESREKMAAAGRRRYVEAFADEPLSCALDGELGQVTRAHRASASEGSAE